MYKSARLLLIVSVLVVIAFVGWKLTQSGNAPAPASAEEDDADEHEQLADTESKNTSSFKYWVDKHNDFEKHKREFDQRRKKKSAANAGTGTSASQGEEDAGSSREQQWQFGQRTVMSNMRDSRPRLPVNSSSPRAGSHRNRSDDRVDVAGRVVQQQLQQPPRWQQVSSSDDNEYFQAGQQQHLTGSLAVAPPPTLSEEEEGRENEDRRAAVTSSAHRAGEGMPLHEGKQEEQQQQQREQLQAQREQAQGQGGVTSKMMRLSAVSGSQPKGAPPAPSDWIFLQRSERDERIQQAQ